MTITNEADGSVIFEALRGRKFRFVAMYEPAIMKVWEIYPSKGGVKSERLGGLRVHDVDVQTLKDIKVWDKLTPEVQKEIENNIHQKKAEVHGLMEKARAARGKRYANVPRELVCIKCQAKITIPPGTLVKRVEKIAQKKQILFTVEDYVKQYTCQVCNPTKGRKSDPNAPAKVELVCKCGKKVSYPHSIAKKQADKKGLTIEKYIAQYKCQKCCPTKGRKKK